MCVIHRSPIVTARQSIASRLNTPSGRSKNTPGSWCLRTQFFDCQQFGEWRCSLCWFGRFTIDPIKDGNQRPVIVLIHRDHATVLTGIVAAGASQRFIQHDTTDASSQSMIAATGQRGQPNGLRFFWATANHRCKHFVSKASWPRFVVPGSFATACLLDAWGPLPQFP